MKINKSKRRLGGYAVALIGGWVAVVSHAGAVGAQAGNEQSVGARIVALGDAFVPDGRQALVDQGRIIFYRPDGAARTHAASVFVNGRYHASLVAGGYSPLCLQSAGVRTGVRKVRVGEPPNDDEGDGTSFSIKRGQTLYLRVREREFGGWGLQAVAESEALAELPRTRLQVHTISRVEGGEDCRLIEDSPVVAPKRTAVAPAPVAAPVKPRQPVPPPPKRLSLQRLVLSGDILFHGDSGGLTNRGIAELDRLIAQLRRDYERIDSLSVTGHTDPPGKNSLKLSRQRADAVMSYFNKQGLRAPRNRSEGRGAAELIVRHCADPSGKVAGGCNQPNRRLVVEVKGLRR